MGWAAIIAAIMQVFGPLLAEWLRKWLESRLEKAAKTVGGSTEGTDDAARTVALFDAALAEVPRVAFARRALLRRIKAHAVAQVTRAHPLTPEEVADVTAAGRAAEDE